MADPSLQSLCCIEDTPAANRTEQYKLLELYQSPFYGLCLASSIIGLLGSLYQLSLRFLAPFPRYQYFNVGLRGNNILFWLALADFNADLGLIFRSTAWFLSQVPGATHRDGTPKIYMMNPIFCAAISAWIQFWFSSSHLWTLIYAIDVRRITYDKPFIAPVYHLAAWGGASILCTIGWTYLYYETPYFSALMQYLPNHIATYIPIVMTCLATPFLFVSAFRQAETSMQRRYARYTTTERRLIDSLKVKFILIVSVFYLCWMPNLVNGLILWISWNNLPMTWIVANWYLMASLNPLQGIFNIMLYKIPKRKFIKSNFAEWWSKIRLRRTEPYEETPLLL